MATLILVHGGNLENTTSALANDRQRIREADMPLGIRVSLRSRAGKTDRGGIRDEYERARSPVSRPPPT